MKTNVRKWIGIGAFLVAACVVLSGCGGAKHQEEATACATQFLDAAQSGDFDKAAEYATDEAMKNLGWSKEDRDEAMDVLYESMMGAAFDITEDEVEQLRAMPEIKKQEELLTEMEYQAELVSYSLDEEAYSEKSDECNVTAKATRAVYDDSNTQELAEGLQEAVQKKTEQFIKTYPAEHPEILELSAEEIEFEVAKELLPEILNVASEQYSQFTAGVIQDQTWQLVIKEEDGKMKITDILLLE